MKGRVYPGGSEEEIQMKIAAELRKAGVHFFHVANERRTSPRMGMKLKRMGVSAGVPDLIIVQEDKPPMALELKTERGRLSDKQKSWLKILGACGWTVAVAFGYEAAMEALRDWGVLDASED